LLFQIYFRKIRIESLKQEFIILLEINIVALFKKYKVVLKTLTKLVF